MKLEIREDLQLRDCESCGTRCKQTVVGVYRATEVTATGAQHVYLDALRTFATREEAEDWLERRQLREVLERLETALSTKEPSDRG